MLASTKEGLIISIELSKQDIERLEDGNDLVHDCQHGLIHIYHSQPTFCYPDAEKN